MARKTWVTGVKQIPALRDQLLQVLIRWRAHFVGSCSELFFCLLNLYKNVFSPTCQHTNPPPKKKTHTHDQKQFNEREFLNHLFFFLIWTPNLFMRPFQALFGIWLWKATDLGSLSVSARCSGPWYEWRVDESERSGPTKKTQQATW